MVCPRQSSEEPLWSAQSDTYLKAHTQICVYKSKEEDYRDIHLITVCSRTADGAFARLPGGMGVKHLEGSPYELDENDPHKGGDVKGR